MMEVPAVLRRVLLFLSTKASACLNSERVFHHKSPKCKSESWQELPSLKDATTDTLQAGLSSGKFTSVDLVQAYLKRIEEVSSLNTVIEINPDALAIASELDAERSAGAVRGPLHGIPILIKENIATNDKMNTTSGSYALLGAKVPRDSTVVRKLREAGAIILGKSNLSQWANFRSVDTTNGWSSMGGQTYGPYYPGQDPSGSSSGSAVASALGLALGCLGTETDGSILSPASKNSVVGIKPTPGLTSRDLVIPISEHQDTIGPMTRTVKDAAIILQAIAGVDPFDNYTSAIPNDGVIPNYVSACQPSALAGARIGISRNIIELRTVKTQTPAFEQAVSVLKAAGATIIDNIDFPSAAEFLDSGVKDLVIQADFPVNLANYLSQLTENPNNVTTLAEVRDFTRSSSNEEFPGRDTALWDRILFEQGWDNTDPRFEDAYRRALYYNGEGGVLRAIERLHLDAVIAPSDGTHTFAAGVGAPVITVPLGFSAPDAAVVKNSRDLVIAGPNLPFGLSFMGAKFTEAKLIGLAYAFEQKTHIRDEGRMYISPKTELADVISR